MKKISLSGGFHNVPKIYFLITDEKYEQAKELSCNGKISGESLEEILTINQKKKASHHFCKIADCDCGGYYRDAQIEF